MQDNKKLTAMIIDDHPMARVAIKALLEANNINVLAEAENGSSGLKLFEKNMPDVVIVDIDLPLLSGIEVVKTIRNKFGNCIFIVISSDNSYLNNKRSAEVGAHAFISKSLDMQNIISAINAAVNGFSYFPFIFNQYIGVSQTEKEMLDSLSKQEIAVMGYLLKGVDFALISSEMNISKKTVITYKNRLLTKLGCSNLIDLYAFSKACKIG